MGCILTQASCLQGCWLPSSSVSCISDCLTLLSSLLHFKKLRLSIFQVLEIVPQFIKLILIEVALVQVTGLGALKVRNIN